MLAGYDVPIGLSNHEPKDTTHSYEHKPYYFPLFDKVLLEHALCVNGGWCPSKQTLKHKPKKDKRTTKKKLH